MNKIHKNLFVFFCFFQTLSIPLELSAKPKDALDEMVESLESVESGLNLLEFVPEILDLLKLTAFPPILKHFLLLSQNLKRVRSLVEKTLKIKLS